MLNGESGAAQQNAAVRVKKGDQTDSEGPSEPAVGKRGPSFQAASTFRRSMRLRHHTNSSMATTIKRQQDQMELNDGHLDEGASI